MDAKENQADVLQRAKPLQAGTEARTRTDRSQNLADSTGPGAAHRSKVVVPDHDLLHCIGRGSYGEVWLARNVMGTYRAVKIVYQAAFEHARPFEREFNGIQKFEPISRSHDGFVDVLQIGRTADYFYYVMELADDVVTGQEIDPATYQAKTLRSQVQGRKPLAFEQCVELGLSLTAALGHLHQKGLIHRDIKPSNIILVHGTARLADIGLVAEQSEAKSFVGTEGFIPPEGPGTPQADIYSLGKVLYEIATGKDRHEFPALPTFLGEATDDAPLLELNSVILKACQGSVQLRYQNCQQMRDDLLLLQSGKSVKRAQAIERRLSLLTRIGFVGATVTVIAVAGSLYVNSLRLRAARAEQERTRQLYVSDMTVAEKEVQEGNIRRAMEALDAHRPNTALQGFEYRYLQQQCKGDQLYTFPAQDQGVYALAYSPVANVLATGSSYDTLSSYSAVNGYRVGSSYREELDFSGELNLFDLGSKKVIHRFQLPNADGIRSVAFSPDGRFLAAGFTSAGVQVWDAHTYAGLDKFFGKEGQTVAVLFTRDSRYVVAAFLEPVYQTPGRIVLLNFHNHTEQTVVNVSAVPPAALAVSPDGKVLAYGDLRSDGCPVVRLWDLEARQERSRIPLPLQGDALALHFSSDSKRLVYGTRGGQVGLWDLGAQLTLLGKHKEAVLSVCFAPTGSVLATSAADGTIKLWDPLVRKEAQVLRGHTNSVQQIAFSPDGTQLASASTDKTVRRWSPIHLDKDVLRGHEREVTTLDFSPDGRWLASAGLDRTVKIWDLRKGGEPRVLGGFTNIVFPVVFSPNGRYLAVGVYYQVKVFDTDSLRPVTELPGNNENWISTWGVSNLVFSKDNRFLFVEVPTVHAYEVGSWHRVTTLRATGATREPKTVASPNGVLALGGQAGIQLYEIGTWRKLRLLASNHGLVEGMAFANDDRLVCVYGDAALVVWDLQHPQLPSELPGRIGRLGAFAMAPDGKTLAISDMSGAIWLRNVATGKELFALTGHETMVNALAFSPDGTLLASGGSDATVRLWRAAERSQ